MGLTKQVSRVAIEDWEFVLCRRALNSGYPPYDFEVVEIYFEVMIEFDNMERSSFGEMDMFGGGFNFRN